MTNPYGRYPSSSAIKRYMEASKLYYAPASRDARYDKTRQICRILKNDIGASESPHKITEKDVFAFVEHLNKMNIKNSTRVVLLRYLKDYLSFFGNDVVTLLLSRRQIRFPSDPPPEIRSLTEETVLQIHKATQLMDGWDGDIARFITLAYPYTGLRPSELRTLKYEDVDIETWSFRVSKPKGAGLYAEYRRVGILPDLRPAFMNFLEARKTFLENHGLPETYEALIPYEGRYGITYWPLNRLNGLKKEIVRLSGIKFKLKDYRPTFCQLAIDRGADLTAVSKIMGHCNTSTTETYYGRIRSDVAILEIERAFSEPDVLGKKVLNKKIASQGKSIALSTA